MKVRRDAFAALGWTVWKVRAAAGVPYAKEKIRAGGRGRDTIGAMRGGIH